MPVKEEERSLNLQSIKQSGYDGKAGTIRLKLSCTAKKNNIPYSFLCGHNSYVERRNKTVYSISG